MHIYFSGIGGAAIGPLARLALEAGHKVSGEDLRASLFTTELGGLDVRMKVGPQDKKDLFIEKVHSETPIDWYVHSVAVPESSPDFQFALKHDIRISKRDELINKVVKDNSLKLVSVSGTHGKTTTTSMLIWLFMQSNLPISYSVGSVLPFAESAKFDPQSKYFIYEADEFDRNFLKFKSDIAVITNVDYDHSETYPTVKDYRKAYEKFIKKSKKVVCWQETMDTIGVSTKKDKFTTNQLGDIPKDVGLLGLHNRKNATLAIKAMQVIDPNLTNDKLVPKINGFPNARRRFEQIRRNLYSDYAHHPTEIKVTLQTAQEKLKNLRKLSKNSREIVVVYQPHQNIRQTDLNEVNAYEGAFDLADRVYWLPTYLSRENPEQVILRPKELFGDLNGDFIESAMDKDLRVAINKELRNQNLVICMSAGNLDEWLRNNFMKVSWLTSDQKYYPY